MISPEKSTKQDEAEYWLRGPVPDVPPLLQPVAHALLQAQKEIVELMQNFPDKWLWKRPAKTASPAFHLQHIAGVLDRLFTYAEGEALTADQLAYLSAEGKEDRTITVASLLTHLNQQIEASISVLKRIHENTLPQTRFVGRRQIPSTQLGLLFHAAEHTMRHNGQLQVTVKTITEKEN